MVDIYTVDAFTDELFKGNPAAVCTFFQNVYHSTALDVLFQQIAMEMNLSETAFITRAKDASAKGRYFIQWFTPMNEVDICGHATLATGHILFERILNDTAIEELIFETKRFGELRVKRCDRHGYLQLDFPAGDPQPIEFDHQVLSELKMKLNLSPTEEFLAVQLCRRTKYLLLHLSTLGNHIKPQESLLQIDFGETINPLVRGIIVTSSATETDFVSRFFCPWYGVLEDPVCGSAHTVLAVYWSQRLEHKKLILHAYQQSSRGGYVDCVFDQKKQRVLLRGSAITAMQGRLLLQDKQLSLLGDDQNIS